MWKVSRKYLLGAAVAGVAALGVTQAQAQSSWSGPYFGVHGGYGWGSSGVDHDVGIRFPNSVDTSGRVVGAHLGLNVHLAAPGGSGLVLGGEFSLSDLSISGSNAVCAPLGLPCSTQADWLLLAMGKVGWGTPTWMLYGTAGLAVAGVTSNDILPAPFSPDLFKASAVHNGFAYGAGWEFKVPLGQGGHGCCGSSVTFGVEYLRVNLDEATHTPSILIPRHVDPDFNVVRGRLSIKLDTCCGHKHGPLK